MNNALSLVGAFCAFLVVFSSSCATPKKTDTPPLPEAPTLTPLEKHYRAGFAALKARDTKIARAEFNECLKLEPENLRCRYEMGWVEFVDFHWDETLKIWNEIKSDHRNYSANYPDLASSMTTAEAHQKVLLEAKETRKKARKTYGKKSGSNVVLKIRAVGDMMLGTDYPRDMLPPPDGPKPLEQIKSYFERADIRFGNLEGCLCDHGETDKCAPGSRCYAFRTPTRFGTYFKEAGINVVSLANNHNADFGETCRKETEAALDQIGIKWSGRPGTVAELPLNHGKTAALVAFHSAPHCNNTCDIPGAKKLISDLKKAKDLSGKKRKYDFVIISFHGGAEGFSALHVAKSKEMFLGEDRGDVMKFARGMIDAGADVVIGSGPHVPRAMEIYHHHLIAYSLGNFATYKAFNLNGFNSTSPLLEIRLDRRGRFVGGRIYPMFLEGEGIPRPDPHAIATDLIRYLSQQDFPDTGIDVARDGTLGPHVPHPIK